MKQTPNSKRSRRKFLSLGLLSGAALLSQPVNAQVPNADEGETIKLLTPDGKLVEVSKHVVSQSAERTKAGNKDILAWTNTQKTSK